VHVLNTLNMSNLDFIISRGKSDGMLITSGSAFGVQRLWDTIQTASGPIYWEHYITNFHPAL